MARKYRLYEFQANNPEKCLNPSGKIILRSSWEVDFARHCDMLPNVIQWGYELSQTQIPYRDALTNTQKIYIPDFYVVTIKNGRPHRMLIEIKPAKEQFQSHTRSRGDAAQVARNMCKWKAATQWCDRHATEFCVLNEADLFKSKSVLAASKKNINPYQGASVTHTPDSKKKGIRQQKSVYVPKTNGKALRRSTKAPPKYVGSRGVTRTKSIARVRKARK